MTPIPIVSFLMRWHPVQNVGHIVLVLSDGERKNLTATASEFAAIGAVLNQAPIYWFADGSIGTAWEPAEDK